MEPTSEQKQKSSLNAMNPTPGTPIEDLDENLVKTSTGFAKKSQTPKPKP